MKKLLFAVLLFLGSPLLAAPIYTQATERAVMVDSNGVVLRLTRMSMGTNMFVLGGVGRTNWPDAAETVTLASLGGATNGHAHSYSAVTNAPWVSNYVHVASSSNWLAYDPARQAIVGCVTNSSVGSVFTNTYVEAVLTGEIYSSVTNGQRVTVTVPTNAAGTITNTYVEAVLTGTAYSSVTNGYKVTVTVPTNTSGMSTFTSVPSPTNWLFYDAATRTLYGCVTNAGITNSDALYLSIASSMTNFVQVPSSTNWLSYTPGERTLYGCVSNNLSAAAITNVFAMFAGTNVVFRMDGTNVYIDSMVGLQQTLIIGPTATNAYLSIGSPLTNVAKVYLNGEGGYYTNKPLLVLNRSATGTGNVQEWQTNGTVIAYVSPAGMLVANDGDIGFPHGCFSSTNSQAITNVTQPQLIRLETTEDMRGMSNDNGRVWFNESGTYLITFSGIADLGGGAANKHLEIWGRTNGTDIVRSNTRVSLVSLSEEFTVAVSLVITVAARDYFEFWTWGDTTDLEWLATPAATGPTRPAAPSVIITVNKVSK